MVSPEFNLDKTRTSEFFKEHQNSTSPKDESWYGMVWYGMVWYDMVKLYLMTLAPTAIS